MKNHSRKALSLLLAMVMMFALLAGCGGGDQPQGNTTTPDAPTTDTPATATPSDTPAANLTPGNGVLDVGTSVALDTLTPFRANIARDQPFFKQIFEALAAPDANKVMQPWVAKTWASEDNGFTYDIEIWDIVYDSEGNHITADDIVWFLEKTHEANLKPAFAKISEVEKTGDYTIRLTLTSNVVGTIERILEDTFIVSQKAFEASADQFGTMAVTTSAYKITQFTASSIIAFEKRDDYWQDEALLPNDVRPNVEKISYHYIPEAAQIGIALETGTIDMACQVQASTGSQFIDNPQFTVDLTQGPQGYQLFFSGAESRGIINDLALRQAICYSIDPQGLITGFCSGFGEQMYDVCPPIQIGYQTAWESEDYYDYNPEKAKELLASSGYNGEELSLLATNTSQRLVEILQNYMLAVGINVKLDLVDMALYTATRLDGTKYDMTINTIGGTYMADHWSTRYDPNGYANGDATSRRDMVFGELLYKTWTPDGYTEENINAVHEYLRDNAIAYGLVNPQTFTIWSNNLDMQNRVYRFSGAVSPVACTYGNI